MKIRLNFVSNSSACSFTCPVCANVWEGWDWDEPICPKCETNIDTIRDNFLDYLIKKYNINELQEREIFKIEQTKEYNERKRQDYIAEYGRNPDD
jgi:hypothetical protein